MGTDELIKRVEEELLGAEHVLCTEFSFDLAEPNYVRCLELIGGAPELRPQFEELLIALFKDRKVSDEPIAYLMHKLRWPKVREWMEGQLREMPDAIATGAPFEKVIAAYSDRWENREFYKEL
ncbi:hypothetical protein [Methylibium rhizosphaerae]|uniref:hypothetical protein n=1 Tax=Methylibium rhizosphaerae TaxID=2570323 RepID=UPI00112A543E|nr:hypothetical protein [Methylibium rhizosphaerae]